MRIVGAENRADVREVNLLTHICSKNITTISHSLFANLKEKKKDMYCLFEINRKNKRHAEC